MPTARPALSDRLNPILVKDLRQLWRRGVILFAVPGLGLLHVAGLMFFGATEGPVFGSVFDLSLAAALMSVRYVSFVFAALLAPNYIRSTIDSASGSDQADPFIIVATGVRRYVVGKTLVALTLGVAAYLLGAAAMVGFALLDAKTPLPPVLGAILIDAVAIVGFTVITISYACTRGSFSRQLGCAVLALPGALAALLGASICFHLLLAGETVADEVTTPFVVFTPIALAASAPLCYAVAVSNRRLPTPRRRRGWTARFAAPEPTQT